MNTNLSACMGCFVNPMPWNIPQTFLPPMYDNIPMSVNIPQTFLPPMYDNTSAASSVFVRESNGITPGEREIIEMLAQVFNKFMALGAKHPADNNEFCTAIHDAQKAIAMRVARRVDTDVWKQFPENIVN